jgi:lipopolysaccharide export system protein LptA
MMRPVLLSLALAVAGLAISLTAATDAAAQAQRGGNRSDPFGGFGGNSREPIRIDANKLEVFDKEQKAVYSGDVVAVRGTAVTRSTMMTIFYESKRGQGEDGKREAQAASAATQDGALKRIEFAGPVTVVNGTQTLKADNMVYDAVTKIVTLRGNATVADGPNIQRGELMTYNTETGVANITGAPRSGGRVQGVFTPGSEPEGQSQPRQR